MLAFSRIREAIGAIHWISERRQFDLNKVNFVGHSQGTLIAVSVAARLKKRQPIETVVLWAPQTNALSAHTRIMGHKVYEKFFAISRDSVETWLLSRVKGDRLPSPP